MMMDKQGIRNQLKLVTLFMWIRKNSVRRLVCVEDDAYVVHPFLTHSKIHFNRTAAFQRYSDTWKQEETS